MQPMLVVGIENTQRRRDMTGPTDVASDREIAPVVGGSAAFRSFIADELVRDVGARYRVTGSRGIIGESLAGLFVVETLFEQPALFDTDIALSPSLWWNAAQLTDGADVRLAEMPAGTRARLWLAWADESNIGPHGARLAASLQAHPLSGIVATVHPRPDLDHATIYRALAPESLPALYPARAAAPRAD